MFDLALLSTASDGGVMSGIVLAAGVVVALLLIAFLEKKTDENVKAQQAAAKAPKAAAPAPAKPAAPAPKAAPAPAVEAGIPAEVIAAIAAAVACLEGEAVIHGIRRAPAATSRRGVLGDAGVAAATTPFMA